MRRGFEVVAFLALQQPFLAQRFNESDFVHGKRDHDLAGTLAIAKGFLSGGVGAHLDSRWYLNPRSGAVTRYATLASIVGGRL